MHTPLVLEALDIRCLLAGDNGGYESFNMPNLIKLLVREALEHTEIDDHLRELFDKKADTVAEALKEHAPELIQNVVHVASESQALLHQAVVVVAESFWWKTLIRAGLGGGAGSSAGIMLGPIAGWVVAHHLSQGCETTEDPCDCQQNADHWGNVTGGAIFITSFGSSILGFVGHYWYQHWKAQHGTELTINSV